MSWDYDKCNKCKASFNTEELAQCESCNKYTCDYCVINNGEQNQGGEDLQEFLDEEEDFLLKEHCPKCTVK